MAYQRHKKQAYHALIFYAIFIFQGLTTAQRRLHLWARSQAIMLLCNLVSVALWGMKQKKARITHGHRPAGGPLAFGP